MILKIIIYSSNCLTHLFVNIADISLESLDGYGGNNETFSFHYWLPLYVKFWQWHGDFVHEDTD